MNENHKKILVLIIIIMIMIIVICGAILLFNKEENTTNNNEQISTIQPIEETEEVAEISEKKYFDITILIRKYYDTINKSNYVSGNGENFANNDFVKKNIYALLSEDYIKKEDITIENLYYKIPDINEKVSFVPTNMKVFTNDRVDKFLVNGTEIYVNSKKSIETAMVVSIDKINQTFSIEPMDKEIDNLKIENNNIEIDKNNYNEYEVYDATEKELVIEKFNNYKFLAQNGSEKLYNMFDEEYKNKKFGNYQGYVQYVEDNYQRLSTMYLTKYKVDELDSYTQYVCIDNYGRYCIFRNKTSTEVEILLDTYTVDLPEFIEKYNKAGEQEKVGMNIEKFINAINEQDYKYGYDLLDDVFKRNNMPTQQDFENYVKDNMYENNILEHNEVSKQGNTFVYELGVKDKNNEEAETKKLTVIMQLREGTDFVMSFSME